MDPESKTCVLNVSTLLPFLLSQQEIDLTDELVMLLQAGFIKLEPVGLWGWVKFFFQTVAPLETEFSFGR